MAEQTFRDYCASQIERLGGAFPDFRFYKPGAVDELVNWLEAKSDGDKTRASQVITEVTEFAELPSIADLNAVWNRLFPPIRESFPDCPECHGTGFQIIERGGISGATRCRCGGVPSADPMLGYVGPGRAA